MTSPPIKQQLRDLIIRALEINYVSKSCKDDIATGNHYQSVHLGETVTRGFRTDRDELLSHIDFTGKRVLDLGSNLGELSRIARSRGAILVDGYEYDPYFIEIANLINAYNNISRVSFFQKNITDQSIYRESYDIVMAFSVFVYLQDVLKELSDVTRDVLVLETHQLQENLHSSYIDPLAKYFPYHRIIGETEWGTTLDKREKRIVIAFARSPTILAGALTENGKSNSLAAKLSEPNLQIGHRVFIDPMRTMWADRFFSAWKFDTPDDLLTAIRKLDLDLDTIADSNDLRTLVTSGCNYWILYIKGYLDFIDKGQISESNIYVNYLMRYFGPRNHDVGIKDLLGDRSRTNERVSARYRDFDAFRGYVSGDKSAKMKLAPLNLILRDPPTPDAQYVYEVGNNSPTLVTIDGFHRLFLARLFGVRELAADVTRG